MVFHIPKAKTSCFGLNILRYDGANLLNKFYHALSYFTILKKLVQAHSLETSA